MAWTSSDKWVFFITVPIATICAGILYYMYFSDDESWDDLGVETRKTRVTEIKVPTDKVPAIVGRGGIKIKEIQELTNTKINFKNIDPDSTFKICRIKGSQEEIDKAEILINEVVKNQPNLITEEVWVPQTACGRIIGRCGETIKQISSQSNANVTIERYTPGVGKSRERQVIIRGTAQEIAVAVSLINAKVAEDAALRQQVDTRSPRHRDRGHVPTPKQEVINQTLPEVEQLVAEASDSMTRVYVSALASPNNFWVQLVLPGSAELDQLSDIMTDYYSNHENHELHKLTSVYKGQIVAARGALDNRWYRAKVYEELKKDSIEPELDIYFVDYGESVFVKKSDCCELRTDFLSLRFQAIECSLHNVQPPHGETSWSESVVVEMEDLVYSAQWKPVLVKVIDFDKTPSDDVITGPNGRPIVSIFDPERGIDVAEELIARGLADRTLPSTRKESHDVSSEDLSTIGGGDESTASMSSLPSLQGPEDSLMSAFNRGGAGDGKPIMKGEFGGLAGPAAVSLGGEKNFVLGEQNASQLQAGDSVKPSKPEGFPGMPQPEQKPVVPQATDKSKNNIVSPATSLPGESKKSLLEPSGSTEIKTPEKKEVDSNIFTKEDKFPGESSGSQKEESPPTRYDPFKSEPSRSTPSADVFLSAERSQADPTMPKRGKEKPGQIYFGPPKYGKPKNSRLSNGNN